MDLPGGRAELLRGLDVYLVLNTHALICLSTARSEHPGFGVGGVWLIWGE